MSRNNKLKTTLIATSALLLSCHEVFGQSSLDKFMLQLPYDKDYREVWTIVEKDKRFQVVKRKSFKLVAKVKDAKRFDTDVDSIILVVMEGLDSTVYRKQITGSLSVWYYYSGKSMQENRYARMLEYLKLTYPKSEVTDTGDEDTPAPDYMNGLQFYVEPQDSYPCVFIGLTRTPGVYAVNAYYVNTIKK